MVTEAVSGDAAHLRGYPEVGPKHPRALAASRRKVGCAHASSGGEPTGFTFSSCVNIKHVHDQIEFSGDAAEMTVEACFKFCSAKRDASGTISADSGIHRAFFGLSHGKTCWCAADVEGPSVHRAECSMPCSGAPGEMCGGEAVASLYTVFDCSPPTADEAAASRARERAAVLSHYRELRSDGTCGQADMEENGARVGGEMTLVGSVDECKLRCATAIGSLECNGFTYDVDASRCSFLLDVHAGTPETGINAKCFVKAFGDRAS